jgi:hypothetical protein
LLATLASDPGSRVVPAARALTADTGHHVNGFDLPITGRTIENAGAIGASAWLARTRRRPPHRRRRAGRDLSDDMS